MANHPATLPSGNLELTLPYYSSGSSVSFCIESPALVTIATIVPSLETGFVAGII